MDSAFFLGRGAAAAPSDAVSHCDEITNEKEEEVEVDRERALLERAERSFDRFCEKVGLPPALRLQARLSWLLDNRATVSGAVAAAAAALLCPRTKAFLAEDPDLMGRAAVAFADGGGENGVGVRRWEGGCPPGRGWGAFVPLAEEMMGTAMRAGGKGTRAWDAEEDGGMVLVGRGSGKRPCARSPREGLQSPRRAIVQPGDVRAGHGNSGSRNRSGSGSVSDGGGGGGGGDSGGGSGSGGSSRDLAQKGWARQQQQSTSTPPFLSGVEHGDGEARQEEEGGGRDFARWRTPSARRREPFSTGVQGDGGGEGGGGSRGGWEEEEGEEQQEGESPGSASSAKRPRARGRTLWQTPRGVGLTPKRCDTNGGSPLSAGCRDVCGAGGVGEWSWRTAGRGALPYAAAVIGASPARRPRARGQTLWETPRGVGLTPKVANARTGEAQLSASFYDRGGEDTHVGGDQEGQQEDDHSGGVSSVKRARARGQTLWQTPRGVGLTPSMASATKTGAAPSSGRYDGDGGGEFDGKEQQREGHLGDACSVKRPRSRGQTLWQTPRGVGLTPQRADARTGASPLSVRYHDDDDGKCGGKEQQDNEHAGNAASVKRPRARGQTLWQTPRGVGLTPKMAGARTEEEPLSGRYRDGGGGECGVEEPQEEEHPASASSAERPRARGQTLWQTPRGVGLTPKLASARTGVLYSDHDGDGDKEDGVGSGREGQQREGVSSGAFSFERPHARGKMLWQTPRGVGLTPKMAGVRTRTPLADRYHDNDGGGGGEYGEEEQQEKGHPGNASSAGRSRTRGQTLWQTPRGVGLTPTTVSARRESPPSVNFCDTDDNDVELGEEEQQEEEHPGHASSARRPRARGQAVWQTPRGVGLTPKGRGGGAHIEEPFSTANGHIGGGRGEFGGEEELEGLLHSGAAPLEQSRRGRGLFPSTPRLG